MKLKLAKRRADTNKGDYGRVGILGGSKGMSGSIYLSSMAALRTGAGLVYSLVPSSIFLGLSIKFTEVIVKELGGGDMISSSYHDLIVEHIEGLDVLALGPGMGRSSQHEKLIKKIINSFKGPIVIDADGLNSIKDLEILRGHKNLVLTPHMGEMARLMSIDMTSLKSRRDYYANYLASSYGLYLVLKDSKTRIYGPEGLIHVNDLENPGLASAGSGDLLTGIIASLLGQSYSSKDACRLAVEIHSRAGDLARQEFGEYGMIASDVLNKLPQAIKSL